MSALALDIGTYSIKAISGKPGSKVNVERALEVFNSTGIVVPTDDQSSIKMAELVTAIINDNKLPKGDVRLSLPETVVSTKIISLPVLTDAELASAIGWQAEQHIPIPPEQLSLEYQVLYRPAQKSHKEQMRVLLIGARKEVVEHYVDQFVALGIEPKVLETQILSVIRSFQMQANEPSTLVVHIGAANTQMAVVHEGELRFVTTHLNGGQVLTRALEKGIGLNTEQAEQYKRTYGLQPNQFEGKVREALLPVVDVLVTEIKKATAFFFNQFPGSSVQRILLSGGGAMLPDLVQYITEALGMEVLVAAPFSSATGEIPESNHAIWSVCMGLLMREE